MEDAADTVVQPSTKKSTRKARKVDAETPQVEAQRKWAKEEKEAKERNPVVESYYELVKGRKLLLCKKKASGSVFRVFIGSTDDKDNGPAIKAQIEKLQKQGKLQVRV